LKSVIYLIVISFEFRIREIIYTFKKKYPLKQTHIVSNVKINELAILLCFSICIVPFHIIMYTLTYKNITSIYIDKKEQRDKRKYKNEFIGTKPTRRKMLPY